ncbi:chemotaxis protein, partial [Malaciobacter halophilus]
MLNNISTRKKLMFFPALFILNIIIAGMLYSYFNAKVKHTTEAQISTEEFIQDLLKGRISVYQFLRVSNEQRAQKVRDDFANLDSEVKQLQATLTEKENIKLADKILELSALYVKDFDLFSKEKIRTYNEGTQAESAEAKRLILEMRKIALELEKTLNDINKRAISLKEDASSTLTTVLLILAIVSSILFILFSVALSSLIVNTLNDFKHGLLSFFSFLNRETSDVKALNAKGSDEFAQMAKVVNENITLINEGLKKDNQAVEDALKVVEKAKLGYLDVQLQTQANNPQLLQLSEALNSMLRNIKRNTDSISVVLKEFSNYKFTSKVDSSGIQGDMKEFIENVNFLTGEISGLL